MFSETRRIPCPRVSLKTKFVTLFKHSIRRENFNIFDLHSLPTASDAKVKDKYTNK